MISKLAHQLLKSLRAFDYTPIGPKRLAQDLDLKGPQRRKFFEALDDLIESGHARLDRQGRLVAVAARPKRLGGTVKKISSGDAFLIADTNGDGPDIFLPAAGLSDAHTGDRVVVELSRRRGPKGRRLGHVVDVVERAATSFVGTFSLRGAGRGFVRVDGDRFDRSIPVNDPAAKGAAPGDKVVIEMLRFPTHALAGEAVIAEVLGSGAAPEVDTLSILREFGLPTDFPEEAIAQAGDAARNFSEDADTDFQGRRDLTGETIVTIDPTDARDFDDAISLRRSDDGHWHLGVHIADVAHFVPPDSALDEEARRRGTSVYLPGRVIPMFPEVLSNGLASLQEGRLRFTKSVLLEFDQERRVLHTELLDSAIRVTRRLSYEQVLPIIKNDANAEKVPADIRQLLANMHELAMGLRSRRFEQGALELDLAETKIELDRDGLVTGIAQVTHDESHQIIEEFMLAANQAVATSLAERDRPAIRRVHGEPDEEKLDLFGEFVGTLGLARHIKRKQTRSRAALQEILHAVRGTPLEQAVNYALLRSFRQAEYSLAPEGHYALAMTDYCHFTSPIRRYADLTVHRLLEGLASGKSKNRGKTKKGTGKEKRSDLSESRLDTIARQCNDRSRRAEAAERELIKVKLLRYMADRVGDEIDAVIVGVERFGLFCRGLDVPAEGLLHISAVGGALGEIMDFDQAAHALVSRTSGRVLQIGGTIRVKVGRVDLAARKLDFQLPDDADAAIAKARHVNEAKGTVGKKRSKKVSGKDKNNNKNTSRQPARRRRRR